MSEVQVFAMRMAANAEYPFITFLLEEIRIHKEVVLQDFADNSAADADLADDDAQNGTVGVVSEGGDAPDQERSTSHTRRVLWLGWLDQERQILAGLISTPRKSKSYPSVTRTPEGDVEIQLEQLHEDARELNFFLYSAETEILLYQHSHGSIGPDGFFARLRVLYNAAKKLKKTEELERAEKKRDKDDIRKRFKQGLNFTYVGNRAPLEELLAKVVRGHVVFTFSTPGVLTDEFDDEYIKTRMLKLTLNAEGLKQEDQRSSFASQIISFFSRIKGRARVNGKDSEGEQLSLDLRDVMKKAALARIDQEEWVKLMSPEYNNQQKPSFRASSFPTDPRTLRVLAPVARLYDILREEARDLQPDSRRQAISE